METWMIQQNHNYLSLSIEWYISCTIRLNLSLIQGSISSKRTRDLFNFSSNQARLIWTKLKNTKTFSARIVMWTMEGISLTGAQIYLLITSLVESLLNGVPRNRPKMYWSFPTLTQEQYIHVRRIKSGLEFSRSIGYPIVYS